MAVSLMQAQLARGGANSVGDNMREIITKGRQERGAGDTERGVPWQPRGEIHLEVVTVCQ